MFAARQSAAHSPLIASAIENLQAQLLPADPTSVGAENICSEQITLGQPLICISTSLMAEVCMLLLLPGNHNTASAETPYTSSKAFLDVICKLSPMYITIVALATYHSSMLCRQTMRLVWKV